MGKEQGRISTTVFWFRRVITQSVFLHRTGTVVLTVLYYIHLKPTIE